jgi:hypothetical protein
LFKTLVGVEGCFNLNIPHFHYFYQFISSLSLYFLSFIYYLVCFVSPLSLFLSSRNTVLVNGLEQGFLTCGVRLPSGGAEGIQGRC